MEELIDIKCPHCGATLKVKQQPGLDKASITCPICKKKSAFSKFQILGKEKMEIPSKDETEIPGKDETEIPGEEKTGVPGEEKTGVPVSTKETGYIVEISGKRWELHPGVNTIGRKLQKPPQQVDIPVTDYTGERRMSRKHAKIEVVQLPNGACKHIISNWQNKNPTIISGEPMDADDRIVLKDGMSVRFANVEVRFVLEDLDLTQV